VPTPCILDNVAAPVVTGVDAVVELMGPNKGLTDIFLSTENLIFEEGIALGLPVRIHLENAILGPSCYIGSSTKPVQIDLTTGQSGELHGASGSLTFNDPFTVTTLTNTKLVNNTFATPAASGCGGLFSLFVDPLVNSIIGLPSGEGTNSATLVGNLQDGNKKAVKNSE